MRIKSLAFAAVLCAALLPITLNAQLPVPEKKPIIGARMPSLSPDGKKLAFVYRGDIWVSDATGGRAAAITRNIEMDAFPQFSPDGNWIAFSSLRNGNWDIYVVPAEGGEVKRLTYHSASDITYGWSPDGKNVLFCSKRDSSDYTLFSLDVTTLKLKKLAQDYQLMNFASYSPDGKSVVYSRPASFNWTRPRYHGSGAAQAWVVDAAKGTRSAIDLDENQQLWPYFMPDGKSIALVTYDDVTPSSVPMNEKGTKFVDSPARTPNIWLFDLKGKQKQLTYFTGGSVRFPNVALKSGDIAFEYGSDLWVLRSGAREPSKVSLFATEDEAQNTMRHDSLKTGAVEAEPSPDGKLFGFVVHGDIWTVLVDKPKGVDGRNADLARRLTDWAGEDSDFVWSLDGKKIYFTSDREFNVRIYEMDVESLAVKPLWNRPEDVSRLKLSPDGKRLGFWVTGPEGGLYSMNLQNGDVQRLIRQPGIQMFGRGGGDYAWSPDVQWLAYTYAEANGAYNVWIMPLAGGDAVNITKLNASHALPTWSPDGKYLYFSSDRDGAGLYAVPLVKEPARTSDFDLKYQKPKETPKVEIDFTDITRRIRKISSQSPSSDLMVTPEGKIFFISDGDVWTVSYDGKDTKRLTTGGGCASLRFGADGKKGFLTRNGELTTIVLDDSGKTEKVDFTAECDRDTRAEHKAAFNQFWRTFNRNFYDPNMHGRDWEVVRKRYEPMLESVETRDEMATLVAMMVGELECSHSEVSPAAGGNPSPSTPHLGFTFNYAYDGLGLMVDKVPTGAPGSFEQTKIKPGDYIFSIDGQDVSLDENLYKMLNDKQGREITFLVNSKPEKEGAKKVSYVAMNGGEWSELAYRNRIDRLRKYTEDKTGGKVGYVHISGMMAGNQQQFDREFYEYALGKKAMVIDVRFNGGGYISDGLIDWLERKPHGFQRTRDDVPMTEPGEVFNKPIIVLAGETSFSNAEMFPYAMKQRGLGKFVGVPTPGYVIAVADFGLVDGTRARMPFIGVYRADGSNMEDNGEVPDYQVIMTADDWVAERDPQLDKAIELLNQPGQ